MNAGKSTGQIAHWPMNDNAASTVVADTGRNNLAGVFNDAGGDPNTDAHTVAGPTGQANSALSFDGSDDLTNAINVSAAGGVRGFSFWMNPTTTTESIFEETDNVGPTISSGTMVYGNWDNCYIDGVDTDTVTTGWHHIVLTSTTDVTMTAFRLGLVNTTYFTGSISDVRPFSMAPTYPLVRKLYRAGGGQ